MVCFRFTCRRIRLILQSLFFSWIHVFLPHGVFVVPFLEAQEPTPGSLVGGCGSSHCTVGGGSWLLNVAPSHCVSALLPAIPKRCCTPAVGELSCTSAIPERCCSRRTMLHCGPRGAMLHLLLPSSTLERCYSVSMHCCYLYTNGMQCNALQCSPKAGNGQKFWA